MTTAEITVTPTLASLWLSRDAARAAGHPAPGSDRSARHRVHGLSVAFSASVVGAGVLADVVIADVLDLLAALADDDPRTFGALHGRRELGVRIVDCRGLASPQSPAVPYGLVVWLPVDGLAAYESSHRERVRDAIRERLVALGAAA